MSIVAAGPLPAATALKRLEGLAWTPHPIVDALIPPLTPPQMLQLLRKLGGEDRMVIYWEHHEQAIAAAGTDPLGKGFELAFWQDVREFLARKDELYLLGGNGPGKTEIGGKLVVEKMCQEKGAKILCVATNDGASKQLQQPTVYKYLPWSARQMNERIMGGRRREAVKKINYSQAGGFTDNTFVLPNGSQCWFKTAEQYLRDPNSFEGPEYDFVWIDEPSPAALDDTLAYRVGKRRGKFLKTFTAVNGFDAACSKVLTGARLLRSLPLNWQWKIQKAGNPPAGGPEPAIQVPELDPQAEQVKGVPAGHMPYMMQPLNPACGVIFMWTQWNVFLPRSESNPAVPSLFDKCKGKSRATVRTRLFGWAEKLTGCQFPQFNTGLHVLAHEKVQEKLRAGELTTYQGLDPAMARSYFMLWAGVDALGRCFVYDESPRMEEGEWVNDRGEKGDGAHMYAGKGVNFYKAYIRDREKEHGQPALRRKGDPRAFATQAAAAGGGKSLLELFADGPVPEPVAEPKRFTHGLDRLGGRPQAAQYTAEDLPDAPLRIEPAKVRARISFEIEVVNDLLAYDDNQPVSVANEPRLFISDRCQNLIRSMLNWEPAQGEDSPWKDPIDTLRYLLDETLVHVDLNQPDVARGRGW